MKKNFFFFWELCFANSDKKTGGSVHDGGSCHQRIKSYPQVTAGRILNKKLIHLYSKFAMVKGCVGEEQVSGSLIITTILFDFVVLPESVSQSI